MSSFALCCTQKKFVGCATSCEIFDTGVAADTIGVHKVVQYWLGGQNSEIVNITVLPNTFQLNPIYNEYASITVKIFRPDGSVFVDGDGNDCFEFNNSPKTGMDI